MESRLGRRWWFAIDLFGVAGEPELLVFGAAAAQPAATVYPPLHADAVQTLQNN